MVRFSVIFIVISAILLSTQLISAQSRTETAFNDSWQFKKGPFSSDQIKFMTDWETKWEDVKIPHTWNADDMQKQHNKFYAGEAYYRKEFTPDLDLKDKQIFIRFEGVGSVADLYLNGVFIGEHKGGYSAFAFNITKELKFGEQNSLLLKVDNASRPDVIPVNHSLFGVFGGIHRPVSLIVTNSTHIAVADHASSGVYISQSDVSSRSADIDLKVKLRNADVCTKQIKLETSIFDADGKIITTKSSNIDLSPSGIKTFNHKLKLKKPHLWNGKKDPYLYRVETVLSENGKILDKVIEPLGVRSILVKAGEGVFLNGEKYPMYGVCRHQDWWGVGNALEKKHHDADLDFIMEIGATTIRLAHYQQSDYFYSRCDSLGLLVWAEVPFVNRVSGKEADNAKSQLRELIRQSYNHPSIYIWGLHNEVYKPHEYTAQLTRDMHDLAKSEDPGRYTVAVNGYGTMEHPVNLNADIQGINRYFGWYEKTIQDIEGWVEGLEQNYPDQPVMLTEYGADSNVEHQTEILGNSIKWWSDFFPETYQTKMHEIQWGVIAKHPYLTASYLWNMFDFSVPMWKRGGVEARNMKGLITIDRKIKKDAFFWYKANWSDQPVVYITQRRNVNREKKITSVTVYSNRGVPSLTVNGEVKSNFKMGETDVHYIFENIELKVGVNIVEATTETETDKIEWIYSKEDSREGESYLNTKQHSGF